MSSLTRCIQIRPIAFHLWSGYSVTESGDAVHHRKISLALIPRVAWINQAVEWHGVLEWHILF